VALSSSDAEGGSGRHVARGCNVIRKGKKKRSLKRLTGENMPLSQYAPAKTWGENRLKGECRENIVRRLPGFGWWMVGKR